MKMLKLTMTLIFISMILTMINKKIMMKKKKKNNNSSYECGFMNINKKRKPMSIQFYIISMIFLIFDLEIMVIIPIMLTMKKSMMKMNKMLMSMMLLMMLITIMFEWLNNSIKWKI